MTLEEALGKITDSEVKAFFTKMVTDQNSYITKLETQLKEQKQSSSTTPTGTNDVTHNYILRKMREDEIAKATVKIIDAVGKEIFEAVKPDFEVFLQNIKPENTNEAYITDAFNLVHGRCLANKNHPIHQVGKTTPNPSGTPQTNAGTNGQQVAQVQNIITGQPPVMSGTDSSAGQGLPGVQGTQVKNTRDAFSRLKDRIKNNGANKFQ